MFSCSHQCQQMFINFPHISKEIETPHLHHYVHHFFTMFPPVFREESSTTCPIFESCPNFKMSRVPKCHPNLYIYTYVYISTTKRCTCPIFSPKFHPFPARLGTAGASRRRDLEQCGGRRESQQ